MVVVVGGGFGGGGVGRAGRGGKHCEVHGGLHALSLLHLAPVGLSRTPVRLRRHLEAVAMGIAGKKEHCALDVACVDLAAHGVLLEEADLDVLTRWERWTRVGGRHKVRARSVRDVVLVGVLEDMGRVDNRPRAQGGKGAHSGTGAQCVSLGTRAMC